MQCKAYANVQYMDVDVQHASLTASKNNTCGVLMYTSTFGTRSNCKALKQS